MTGATVAIDNVTGEVGTAYTGQATVTVTPVDATGITTTYALSGTGAAGLSVSATGAITGTPTAVGTATLTGTVKDDSGTTKTATATITVSAAAVSETPGVMASHYQAVAAPSDTKSTKTKKGNKK
ncbi:putative Ig domain-containing protein [Lelliottia wanjuensis]|uniref:putative Ig domain-containing protein n=1 Tax=Lelliottia wanjuensis TaxID=3050585 RepID=UPI00254BA94C|nr:putative Ig domain-containing protein [Lelliottia sp. V86_10]MDK9586729.1 putative Ig domain-containing protein [Lelliottia sp. V86_10]